MAVSRNLAHDRTHYVGDDCPGGHQDLAFPAGVCRCTHSINYHRLVNDVSRECFRVGCGCAQYRPPEETG